MFNPFLSLEPGRTWRRFFLHYGTRRNAAATLRTTSRAAEQSAATVLAKPAIEAAHTVESRPCPVGNTGWFTPVRQRIARLDSTGRIVSVNSEWQASVETGDAFITGVGNSYVRNCELLAAKGVQLAAQTTRLTQRALSGVDARQKLVYAAGDSWFSLQVLSVPREECAAIVVIDDITAERAREQELRHRAFHDPLTGLPNRGLLTDRLDHAVAGAARETHSLAVLFIDLDDFKSINDGLGHLAGDDVVCEAARRLADCVRTSDTVGRWGGDEFVVIAERLDVCVTANALAERITQRLAEPMQIAGCRVELRATIGVAVLGDHESAGELVAAADRALIAARDGRPPRRTARDTRTLIETSVPPMPTEARQHAN